MKSCGEWLGVLGRVCGVTPDEETGLEVRLFLPGWRCPAHTPAALAGRSEPTAGYCAPNRCYCRECESWTPYSRYPMSSVETWKVDARNVAKGKAHAPKDVQDAAKAEVAEQKARNARLRKAS